MAYHNRQWQKRSQNKATSNYHLLVFNDAFMSHILSTTAWNINECKSFPLLFAYFFVIFTYYSCEYVYIYCVAHAYHQTYPVFYNFHLFIIISQRRQKHFQFTMINDVDALLKISHFSFPSMIIIMTLICTSSVVDAHTNRVNCREWKAFSEHKLVCRYVEWNDKGRISLLLK